jgi:8-oxo-dGTP pyrophosphatase MutT (NUDIX family)
MAIALLMTRQKCYYTASVMKNLNVESIAKILIVNASKEALVLTLGEHLQYPEKSYLPDLPGGITEAEESTESAAVRETKEETGIILSTKDMRLAYAKTAYYPEENKSVTKLLYLATLNHTPELTLSWEHISFAWVPLHELLGSTTFRPFFHEAIEYSLANNLI